MKCHAAPFLTSLLLPLLVAADASAWGNKEHIQLTRMAAQRLIADPQTPPAMRKWLEDVVPQRLDEAGERDYFLHKRVGLFPRGVDGALYWVTVPDSAANGDPPGKKAEGYPVAERLLHYVDVEFFMADEAKRTYAHDLSHKPNLADFPDDAADARYLRAGMLPFRVRECYDKLVASIRAGKLNDAPGQFPRDEHATKWAGYLAHYVGDNTQPHHATVDYKSAAYFADKRKAPNVHSEVEYRMNDDEADDFMPLREVFWPLFVAALKEFEDPVKTDDPFKATLEVSLASYDALPLIGQAAMAAAKQGGTPEKPEGPAEAFDTNVFFRFKGKVGDREMTVLEMKARQQASAVKRIERMWRQAWDAAQQAVTNSAG